MSKIATGSKQKLPRNVLWLSAVSFLTDTASDMAYPFIPAFVTGVLKGTQVWLGLIEGLAESVAALLKLWSGWLSDRLQRRKPLIIIGYTLAGLAKPLLGFATVPLHVLGIRFLDRTGKGIRTSPRDAMIAIATPKELYGRAFGFHRSADSAGAILGPLLGYLLFTLLQNNYRTLFFLSAIPMALALFCLFFFVRELPEATPDRQPTKTQYNPLPTRGEPAGFLAGRTTLSATNKGKLLPKEFKLFLLVITLFSLGNSSDTFLLLRAQTVGIPVTAIPVLWLFFNVVYTAFAYPVGKLTDKIGRAPILVAAFLLYASVYSGFAFINKPFWVWLLFLLYGLYYGLAEGSLRAFVADLVPADRLGRAYGLYHGVVGLCLLPASLLLGWLWKNWGPAIAFGTGAGLALLAAILFLVFLWKHIYWQSSSIRL